MRLSVLMLSPDFPVVHRLLVLVVFLATVRPSLSRYCLAEDTNPYLHFASKTAYDLVRGTVTEVLSNPGCHPRLFYFVARHGTRYPSKKIITQLNEVLPPIKDQILEAVEQNKVNLCEQDVENWRSWNLDLNESLHYELTTSGQQEMVDIATRFKERVPSLLQPLLFVPVPSSYDIKFSDTARSRDSAHYFLKGLLGEGVYLNDSMKDDDRLLRAYKNCVRWQQEVNKNNKVQATINEFENGPEMQKVLEEVGRRLGLDSNFSYDGLNLMYEMCRYEKSWNRSGVSPWCAAFTKEHLHVLEYAEDLKYYIEDGYGYPVNYDQLCLPVQDIVQHFREAVKTESPTSPRVILRFSHSGFLLKLFARLGLYNDTEPLTANNRMSQGDRKWRTSSIDPFSANLALVLWSCNNDYQVSAFVNEHEIRLPRCSTFPCPIRAFLNGYGHIADDCDLDNICALPARTGGAVTPVNVALTTSIALVLLALMCHCLKS